MCWEEKGWINGGAGEPGAWHAGPAEGPGVGWKVKASRTWWKGCAGTTSIDHSPIEVHATLLREHVLMGHGQRCQCLVAMTQMRWLLMVRMMMRRLYVHRRGRGWRRRCRRHCMLCSHSLFAYFPCKGFGCFLDDCFAYECCSDHSETWFLRFLQCVGSKNNKEFLTSAASQRVESLAKQPSSFKPTAEIMDHVV
jgi:hypothetical protein